MTQKKGKHEQNNRKNKKNFIDSYISVVERRKIIYTKNKNFLHCTWLRSKQEK